VSTGKLVVRKAARRGAAVKVTLPLTRGELAQWIAVTPEQVSRLLRQFREDGVIRMSKGWIVVPADWNPSACPTDGGVPRRAGPPRGSGALRRRRGAAHDGTAPAPGRSAPARSGTAASIRLCFPAGGR